MVRTLAPRSYVRLVALLAVVTLLSPMVPFVTASQALAAEPTPVGTFDDYVDVAANRIYRSFVVDVSADDLGGGAEGTLTAALTWEGTADLDLFVRPDGEGTAFITSSTTDVTPEQLSFTASPGSYLFTVKANSGATDFELATAIQWGTSRSLLGTSEFGGQRWRTYEVPVSAPGLVTADLGWSGDADLTLNLRDPDGNVVKTSKTVGQPEALTFDAQTSGVYELVVSSDAGGAAFEANVEVTADPTERTHRAVVDAAAQRYQAFEVTAPERGSLTAALAWDGDADLDLFISPVTGGTIGPIITSSATSSPSEQLTIDAEAGTYRVIAKAVEGVADFELTTSLQTGSERTYLGTSENGGQQWRTYALPVDAAGLLTAQLDWAGDADLSLYLRDPGGGLVKLSKTQQQPELLAYDVTEVGDHELVVSSEAGTGAFTLTTGLQTATDARRYIGTIGDNGQQYAAFDLAIGPDALQDGTGTLSAILDGDGDAELDLFVRRLGDGDPLVASSVTGVVPEQLSVAVTPGDYRLIVAAPSGAGGFALETTIQTGADLTLLGTSDRTTNQVYRTYSVTVPEAGDLDVQLDRTADTGNLFLEVLDSGARLGLATGSDDPKTLSVELPDAGIYDLKVWASLGRAAFAASTTFTPGEPNTPPTIEAIADQTVTEGEPFGPLDVVATDDDGDGLTLDVSGLPAGVSFDAGAGTISGPPDPDTSLDSPYTVTVTADDGTDTTDLEFTLTVEAAPAVACAPVSTLSCPELQVAVPYTLDFDGTEGGLDDTGFTLVDAPSDRDAVDQTPAPASPSFADVPGYEPGLLTVSGGTLTIDATKGIQYATPDPVDGQQTSGIAGINAQLNGLGVAVAGGQDTYELTTSLVAPAFDVSSGGAQQAGLWWFVDEDRYIKLVVTRVNNTTNRVQLAVESLDAPTADDPDGFFELNSAEFGDGQDVALRMAIDAVGDEVTGFYSVDGALEVQVASGGSDSLIIPAVLADGVALDDGLDQTVNAGVFATKRSAPASDSVTATFADFSVDAVDVNNAPEIDAIADVAVTEGETIDAIDVVATDADGDELAVTVDGLPAGVTFDDGASVIIGTPDAGTAGSYDVTVTADDATTTTDASFTMTVLDPAADFTANVNFNSATGQQPAGYERDFGLPFGDRGNGLTYGWVEAADGTTPLDLTGGTSGNGRDRGTSQADQRLDSLVHMQANDITADGDTFSGVDVEGVWELAVPNGTYAVTVAAGDPSVNNYISDPEEHALNVEGSQAVAPFTPVGIAGDDGQHGTGTVTVEVTDGLLTIDADGGTNTKIHYVDVVEVTPGANTAPVVDPIADVTTTVDEPLDPAVQVVADDADAGDILIYTAAGLPAGLAIDQSFGVIEGTPTETGTFDVTVTVDDGTDTTDVAFTITVEEAVVAASCHDISTLPCDDVTVALPYAVGFDGSEGGLADIDGDGTGFTMAQAPSNKETQDPAPTVAEVPGYVADQLDVDAGGLTIGATNGLAYASLSGGTTTSTNVNSQQNTLGVGFDAAAGPFTLEATLDVDFPGNNNFQQAGLWFGLDEDNYVKVVARETNSADTMAFEILREIDSDVAPGDSTVTDTVPEGPVKLILDVDPATGDLTASYLLDGATDPVEIDTLTGTPQVFFDGELLPDGEAGPASFAGVFASARRASEANRIAATFTDFSIDAEEPGTGDNTAPEVLLTGDRALFANQGTMIPVDTFDEDGDAVTVSVTGLPDGLTYNGTQIAGVVDPAALAGSPFTVEVTGDDGTDTTTETFQVEVIDEVAVDINFQDGAAPVPDGYLEDFGEPFGERTGANQGSGLSYGWVAEGTTTPLSLVDNGRDRNRADLDQRLDTFIHMQYGDIGTYPGSTTSPNCAANVCAPGAWEMAVPDGLYEVTLAVGDQPSGSVYDSVHAINVESGLAILEFQSDTSEEYLEVTAQAGVEDGRLTIDAIGGNNSKLSYVQVRSLGTQPFATQMIPPNRATDVDIESAVSASVSVPGTGVGVNPDRDTSLTDEAVKLFKVTPTGEEEVTGNRGSTGGNDTIAFSPQPALEYDTTYRYVIDGANDEAGNVFGRFESTFTTAADDGDPGDPGVPGEPGTFEPIEGVDFEQVLLPEASGSTNGKFIASMEVHQGHLWYTTVGQGMFRHEIEADGTLGLQQDLGVFQGRAAIGLVFDQDDPDVAWVTHATANLGNESARIGSKVSTVDFSNVAAPVVQDVFVNLPRSQKDHLSNSIIYGPAGDAGDDWLYFLQGSNTAAGDTDSAWGARGETQLTAALLRFDPQDTLAEVAANGPIDVATEEVGGTYDPFGPDAPLEIYATGIRNAYDLVWHSNGHIYVPTNGTAAGGSSPGVANVGGEWIMQSDDTRTAQTGYDQGTNVTDECATRRADGAYTGGDVPAVTGHPTQYDFLFAVEQDGYYGHPNPTRCEWVLNAGSDSPGSTGNDYPAGTEADPNYSGFAYNFDFNKSPNGIIEYQSQTFGGALDGRLMVVRFSNNDDILTMQVDGTGAVLGAQPGSDIGGFSGSYADPLELIEDTSVNPGNIYLNQYNRAGEPQQLYLLRVPSGQQAAQIVVEAVQDAVTTDKLIMSATLNTEGPTDTDTVTVSNSGTEPVDVTGSVTGTDADQFSLESVGTIPAGGSVDVDVTFDPSGSSAGVRTATLSFTTGEDTAELQVRALAHLGQEGGEEPTLQQVMDTFEYGLDSGWSGLAGGVDPAPVGDEVDINLFERAADGPVTMSPVGGFAPFEALPFGWYADTTDAATLNELGVVDNGQQQTLLPTYTSAGLEFDPGTDAFGVYYDSNFFNRVGYTEDARNTDGVSHRARIYPLAGDQFLVAFEDASNGDYQDYMFVLQNVVAAGEGPGPDPDPIGETLRFNFQSETAPVPADHLRDFGEGYAARTGADQGDGLSYGWVDDETFAPLDLVDNGRDRGSNDDQRLDTLMHMDLPPDNEGGTQADGSWELALADGSYAVTVSVGDPNDGGAPESHTVNAEGVNLVDGFPKSTAANGSDQRHTTGTAVVEVSDGHLTIDQIGGTNTKINYLEVTPVGDGGETVAQVNFQPAGSSTPADWAADSGELFTAGRGYGWVGTEGGAAKDADTRDRAADSDPLDGTLIIVDDAQVGAVVNGDWEYALSDGTYQVTVSVGDPEYADSTHGVIAEGTSVVDGFTPSAAGAYQVGSAVVEVTDGALTLSSSGTNTKFQWVTIASSGGGDVIPPQVAISLDGPGSGGAFTGPVTVSLDVTDATLEFVDVFVDGVQDSSINATNFDTPFEVSGIGGHTVEVVATDGSGNQTTETAEFSIIETGDGAITLTNPEAAPYDDRLVMSRIQSTTSSPATNETANLVVGNDGSEDLVISGLDIADSDFELVDAPVLPLTLGVGEDVTLESLFVGVGSGSNQLFESTLTITHDGSNGPGTVVELAGQWQSQSEGGNEPNVVEIVDAFGFGTTIAGPGEQINNQGRLEAIGDEVLSQVWTRADDSSPVTVRQLAAYHTCCSNTATFKWHQVGNKGAATNVLTHNGQWAQTLLPRINGSQTNPALATFTPGPDQFSLSIDPESSDWTLNNTSPDSCGSGKDGCQLGHHLRIWPAEDRDGEQIGDSWIVVMDYSGINYDYNDNVYLVDNLAPVDAVAPTAPTGLAAAVDADDDVVLAWDDNAEGDLDGYLVQRATAATGPWTTITASPVAESAHTDTGAPRDTTVFYRVVARDLSGNDSDPSDVVDVTTPPGEDPIGASIRINAGGPAQTVGGTQWSACSSLTNCNGWVSGGFSYSESDTIAEVPANMNQTIFQSEWTGGAAGPTGTVVPVGERAFGFDVPVLNGDYLVRLHFAELNKPDVGTRVFDVELEGEVVLADLDITDEVGLNTATVFEFPVQIADELVTIDFIRDIENAKISAIEILPAPAG